MQFYYTGVDRQGNHAEGLIASETRKDALRELKEQNIFPTELYVKTKKELQSRTNGAAKGPFLKLFAPRVPTKHLVSFVSDFSVLLDAALPLVAGLGVMAKQTVSKHLKHVAEDLRRDVETGSTFSEALSKHPECFNRLFLNMVRAGEVGGILNETMARIAQFLEKNARLNARMWAALTYPAFVLFFAGSIVMFMLIVIVPKFFVLFEDLSAELPLITRILLNLSTALAEWWLPIGIGFLLVGGLCRWAATLSLVKRVADWGLIHMPIMGGFFRKVCISRFCRTFGTLLDSGVPILQTIDVAKEATGNVVYEEAIAHVAESVKEGDGIGGPLSQYAIFPPLVVNMIQVGEESGALSRMLIKIADRYDEEVDVLVSQLASLIEPILIVMLGFIVGGIVIALFLPMLTLVQSFTGM